MDFEDLPLLRATFLRNMYVWQLIYIHTIPAAKYRIAVFRAGHTKTEVVPRNFPWERVALKICKEEAFANFSTAFCVMSDFAIRKISPRAHSL